jgi:NADPH:quinone reductase-like Zn-dependent oxidoreductase
MPTVVTGAGEDGRMNTGLERYFGIKGRTVLLTGATRGIGLAMADAFADAGARLVVASNEMEACLELGATLRSRGLEALARSPRRHSLSSRAILRWNTAPKACGPMRLLRG